MMNAERRLKKATISIMRDEDFALLASVAMIGEVIVNDDVPTACTDGRNEYYGRAFVDSLTDKELAFVRCHEIGHKMFRHLLTYNRLNDKNPLICNQAMDHVLNLYLLSIDPSGRVIVMPKYKEGEHKGKPMGLADPRFRGMDTKQVFDILCKEEEGQGQGEGEGEGEDDDGEGEGEGQGQPGKPGKGKPGKGKPGKGKPNPNEGGMDSHDWAGAKALTDEEQQELAKEIDEAVRHGLIAQKARGKGAGGLARELEDLMAPKVDWREALRDFVKSTCKGKDYSTWRKPSRRYLSQDLYLPSSISESLTRVVVAVDTSGSISGAELTRFLTEIQSIAEEVNPQCVDLLYWDGEVAAHEEYQDGAVSMIAQSTKPKGGGGTAPSCVPKYLNEKRITPDVIVMFTDGHVGGDWGNDWPAPLMWVVHNNKRAMAAHGITVHIEGE